MTVQWREQANQWFEGKQFTADWFTRKIPHWRKHLKRFAGRPTDVLELGSYEGRSSLFILDFLPESNVTCVDIFNGEFEHRFDDNVREFRGRVTKVKGRALTFLDESTNLKRKYHMIYIDAGKKRDPVLAMSLIAWPLLRSNGVLIWDDYEWGPEKPSESRPHDAIDKFLEHVTGQYEVLWQGSQVMIRKTSASKQMTAMAFTSEQASDLI